MIRRVYWFYVSGDRPIWIDDDAGVFIYKVNGHCDDTAGNNNGKGNQNIIFHRVWGLISAVVPFYQLCMDIASAVILGLVEGLTEFIPVSSTGHLILVREYFGLQVESGLAVDALLNMSAVCAVLVYFFRDIVSIVKGAFAREKAQQTLVWAIAVGTIPAILAGLYFEKYIENTFRNPMVVALGLILGSFVFILAEKLSVKASDITVKKGLVIGVFQALALIPGMSRSGMSISGGLLMGLTREKATRFAFLLSAPIIFGAGSKKLADLYETGVLQAELLPIAVASIVAFLSGLLAIHFMLMFLRTRTLMPFVWYRVALAALLVVYTLYFVQN